MLFRALVFLGLALCAPSVTQAQRCRAEDQVMTETPVALTDFVVLLTIDIPESCGEFSPLDLLPCRNELNVMSGCCVGACRGLFEEYTLECLEDLTEVLCSTETTAAAVPILNGMAARCDDDYAPLSCGDSPPDIADDTADDDEAEDDHDDDAIALGSVAEPEFEDIDLEEDEVDDDDDHEEEEESHEEDDEDHEEEEEEEEAPKRRRRGMRGL